MDIYGYLWIYIWVSIFQRLTRGNSQWYESQHLVRATRSICMKIVPLNLNPGLYRSVIDPFWGSSNFGLLTHNHHNQVHVLIWSKSLDQLPTKLHHPWKDCTGVQPCSTPYTFSGLWLMDVGETNMKILTIIFWMTLPPNWTTSGYLVISAWSTPASLHQISPLPKKKVGWIHLFQTAQHKLRNAS